MKKLITITILLLSVLSVYAQNISGKWEGELYQADNKFKFEIEISQSEVQISGSSKLITSSGQAVEFKLKGFFDGGILYFTDTEPITQGEYCTKFAKLTLLPQKNNGNLVFEGPWNASDCASVGSIRLEQKEKNNITVKNIVSEKLSGSWTGDLVQEGIVYDFYYKVTIPSFSSNMGVSYCVIEEHGIGSANQVFNYTFDEKENKLLIKEYEIIYEDGEPQIWCIKNMVLDFQEKNDKYVLKGNFTGTSKSKWSDCNPGTIYLEKPKLEVKEKEKVSPSTNRNLNITKSFKTDSEELVIKFWDAGNIDNDIVSIYLNDSIILEKITLKRDKEEFKIKLDKGENYLIFHAENLGEIPPNTAAFEIKINGKKEVFKMNADLKNSDAILIRK